MAGDHWRQKHGGPAAGSAFRVVLRGRAVEGIKATLNPQVERLQTAAEDRLQGVLEDLARWLRDSGHPQKTALMLKELGRTDEGR
jgi:hypothetical protein